MVDALRIGLAGLGTVGGAVWRLLNEKAPMLTEQCGRPLQIVGVSARSKSRHSDLLTSTVTWYDNPSELARSKDIDVFVELIGGEDGVAKDCVEVALREGRHVVTANKALLARHGVSLAKLAERKGGSLNFEAAVAGGIPIISVLRESLIANDISRVYGILNGTCNYILTRMGEENASFSDCLSEAQRLGYAEADPSFDVEGHDTAHKLAILTSLAFGSAVSIDDIYIEGISNISAADIKAAAELGYKIKLLGVALQTETGIEQRVHPTMVPADSTIAQVVGVSNAVAVQSDLLGELFLSGPGAGGCATASAVVSDLSNLAKVRLNGAVYQPVFRFPASELKPYKKGRMRAHAGGYFIRLSAYDKAGVFASVAKRMAENNISLESIVQRPMAEAAEGAKTIILVTHQTTESAVRRALVAITEDGNLSDKPQMIRIERPA